MKAAAILVAAGYDRQKCLRFVDYPMPVGYRFELMTENQWKATVYGRSRTGTETNRIFTGEHNSLPGEPVIVRYEGGEVVMNAQLPHANNDELKAAVVLTVASAEI